MSKTARYSLLVFLSALLLAPLVALDAAEPATPQAAPSKKLTILAIGAHMDDAEGGIGSILISAVQAGHRVVVVVAVSDLSSWKPTMGREEQCKADQLALAKRFGWEKRFLGYPYHQLEANNELKKQLAEICDEVQPDIAFVQSTDDHWPDHVASGIAGKDAVLFPHGLSTNKDAKRCPRVFAYCSAPNQAIQFEPDFYVDATPVIGQYMDLIAGTDMCLNGKPIAEQLQYELRNLKTNEVLRMSYHGWQRCCQCVTWAAQSNTSARYALGLKIVWGPRDGSPLW
jgi:LmbE family N-acetylglucosaminyl deacetylase